MKVIAMKGEKPEVDNQEVMHVCREGNCMAVASEGKITKVQVLNNTVRVFVKYDTGTDVMDMPFTDAEQVVVEIK